MRSFRLVSALSAAIVGVAAGTTHTHALSVGEVTLIEHDVKGKPASGQNFEPVMRGDEVYQDEFIHTGPQSRGQFSLLDTTTIELGPKATMKIDSVVFYTLTH
jgi:hypothetical protein